MSTSPKRVSLRLQSKVAKGQSVADTESVLPASEAQPESQTKPIPTTAKPWCSEDVVLTVLAAVLWIVGVALICLLLLNMVFDLSGPVHFVRFLVDTAMESFWKYGTRISTYQL